MPASTKMRSAGDSLADQAGFFANPRRGRLAKSTIATAFAA
jgi:hypothetical protein